MLIGLSYMHDSYPDTTSVSFGAIEAYARRHLRVVGIAGTAITLSLFDASDSRLVSSPLLNLKEGAGLEIAHLTTLLPSIGMVVWDFASRSTDGTLELATVSDGIRVVLSIKDTQTAVAATVEAQLRGIAARLVVGIRYCS